MIFSDRLPVAHRIANRTPPAIEKRILELRRELKDQSDLGEFGAIAIRQEMIRRGLRRLPAVRTINDILGRHGVFDSHKRLRLQPPPAGWSLPDVAETAAEVDVFDVVEGLRIKNGPEVEVLNAMSLHGRLADAWPEETWTSHSVCEALSGRWRQWGLPT